MRRPIVAIDGPAGSGKSTTARAVAQALGYAHVDSGAVYRACTRLALDRLGPPETWTPEAVVRAAEAAPVTAQAGPEGFAVRIAGRPAGPGIRAAAVDAEVSRVAAMAPVRDFVNRRLREAARNGGVVMDGRDIGTVVFPDAEVKVFLVAEAEERARRRLADKGERADRASLEREVRDLGRRDARDSSRAVAPLQRAPDAVLIDTTRLSFDEQVHRVVELVRALHG